jgi:hypothetical protein
MTMNDPRRTGGNTTAWVGGIIAVLVIVGLIWWGVEANRTTTASNPNSQTTGQSSPAPAPAPAGR